VSIDRLYKYGRLNEFSEQLFSSGTIWFASPSALNDPFECRPLISFDASKLQKVSAIAQMLRRRPEFATEAAAAVEADRLWSDGSLNDPARWEAVEADLLHDVRGVGLYCLSKVSDSILMWSHYGHDHRGYCLEFAASNQTPVFGAAQEVGYSEDYPSIDFFNTPQERQVALVFLTKYVGWSYEQEWRIIDYKTGPGLKPYPPELLKSVILGARMPEHDKAYIRAWVGRRGHPVEIHQAHLHERKFSIEIRTTSG
jgi:hypothetical protein